MQFFYEKNISTQSLGFSYDINTSKNFNNSKQPPKLNPRKRKLTIDPNPNRTKLFRSESKIFDSETSSDEEISDFEGPLPNFLKSPIEINNIDDLIKLGKTYHSKNNKTYFGIDLKTLKLLVEPLEELKSLVGMHTVKENLINQIVFFLQGFNKQREDDLRNIPNNDMMHTVITGPHGVGKTELGKILGKVYKAMGILSTGKMKVVGRADLIGKYLGHTASKTQEVIDDCKGGVLFIDEAYALGNAEGRDSFSKECIDTLNQNLTERRDFLCIIAGYKDALDKCFFSYNEGLRRRFTFRYDIEAYTPDELKKIFLMKVSKEGWGTELDVESLSKEEKLKYDKDITKFFIENISYFPHFGGDIESLFLNCKIYHGRRVLFLDQNKKKILTLLDIEKGFETFITNRKYKDKENNDKEEPWRTMYI
ncbi:MAG: hypothetical protein CMF62_01770 [Magnetococcales bacterium]|nr:hypothetical protein [Magnetococcales bacterium]